MDFIEIKKEILTEDWEKDIINNFKEKYYAELDNKFGISKSVVDNIQGLDSEEKREKEFHL